MKVEKPAHVSRSYRQVYEATPEKVFPLLCPVREADWIPGWDPRLVVSASGIAEKGCVFVRKEDDGREGTWMVTEYQPDDWRISFVKIIPDYLASTIEIELQDAPDGGTFAYVTYAHTALSDDGRTFVDGFTEEAFEGFMQAWMRLASHYLKTGEMLRD